MVDWSRHRSDTHAVAHKKERGGTAFPAMTHEAWESRVERESKAPVARLETKLEEGRVMRPLYSSADADALPGPRAYRATRSAQPEVWTRVSGPDLAEANRRLLIDLAGGAGGLILELEGPSALPVASSRDLERLLKDVQLDAIHLAFGPTPRARQLAEWLFECAQQRQGAAKGLQTHLGFDPVGISATFGGTREDLDALYDDAAQLANTPGAAVRTLGVGTVAYHEAGASADFELACLLGSLVATLRALEARGVSPEAAAKKLTLTLTADADFMLGLVKLRAARILAARVCEAAGVAAEYQSPPLLVVSSRRMLTRFEPFVNALRGTAASFAALVGGADFVEVAPYDERLSAHGSDAGRRLARNTTHVLLEEAQLARVQDAAAGAYFFEAQTRALAQSAWQSFRAMERDGGFIEALWKGQVALVASANGFEQSREITHRRRALTGITEFAEPSAPMNVTAPEAPPKHPPPALEPIRWAEPFERLRKAAEAHRAKTGALPEVQLLGLGELAEHSARSTWVTNLLAAGGIVVTSEARPVVVISGADERYEAEAAPLAQKLRVSGKIVHLSMAGKPKHETAYRLAGYDSFIYRGEDVVAFLAELHLALGVKS